MTTPFSPPDPYGAPVDLIRHSARLIRMRWLAGLAALAATPLSVVVLRVPLPDRPLVGLGVVILAYNGLLLWVSRRSGMGRARLLAGAQFAFDWLALDEVLDALRGRPDGVHVVITGRKAPQRLIAFADLVTEMREVKHPYQQGIKAQAGLDF